MSHKERERLAVLSRLVKRELTCVEAAESLGLTRRQIYRIRDRYIDEGDEGLIHRLRGATSNFGYGFRVRKLALDLFRERYSDYGPTLFAEMLEEHHVELFPQAPDSETLRRWLGKAGLWSTARKRRAHRRKRERRAAIGSLLQFDGSDHDWFEGRGKPCCLLVAIDDASGLVWMRFAPSENSTDVLLALRAYIEHYGIPREIYTDKGGVYRTPDGKHLTDVGRALTRMGITMITAHSPQAKGRVERSNRTHQDRLVKALRRHGISTIEAANRFLTSSYLGEHNSRFAITKGLKNIHRPSSGLDLDNIFCFETTRCVYNDYTITLAAQFIQLERSNSAALPVPGRSVTLRRWLNDDSLHIFFNNQELTYSFVKVKPKRPPSYGHQQPVDHPWRLRPVIGRARYRNNNPSPTRRLNLREKTVSSPHTQ